jgi:hypothetical protein
MPSVDGEGKPTLFVRLCANCAAYLREDERCDCSRTDMVFYPDRDDYVVPTFHEDFVDQLVVALDKRVLPAGVVVGGIEDEPPAAPKRRAARKRFVQHRSESSIQEGCKGVLMLAGYVVVTTASKYMQNGTPDLLGCVGGRMVAVEVKRPGEKPRPDQFGELRRWQKSGALVGWACAEQDIRDLLEHVEDRGWINPLTGPGDGRQA